MAADMAAARLPYGRWGSLLAQYGAPSKEGSANFLSRWFFWWCNGIVSLGYKRPLQHTDLPAVLDRDDAARYEPRNLLIPGLRRTDAPLPPTLSPYMLRVSAVFEQNWAEERAQPKPSLVRALRKYARTILLYSRVHWS